jgi:predicted membrane protein
LDAEFAMGAGDMDLDLSQLTLDSLEVSQGVGQVKVSLASHAEYRADINQAIGSIIVDIPEGVGVRIEISRAISALTIPSSFDQRGDYYYSPGYESADYKIDVEISQAIGSIEIRFAR